MKTTHPPQATPEERHILRELAKKQAEIISHPEMRKRIRLWRKHNDLRPERPMILLFPEGGWEDITAVNESLQCRCQDPLLRSLEHNMRTQIYSFEHFASDNVIDTACLVPKAYWHTGWGVEAHWVHSENERGANKFDPVIVEPGDLKKLTYPEVIHDEKLSRLRLEYVQDLLGDILPVALKGQSHISFHLMAQWTALHGLEETMMDMVDEPQFVHEAMAILEEGNRRLIQQYEGMGLLDLNHDNSYQSTGGNGWLPEQEHGNSKGKPPRLSDIWASAESQELTLVSPPMHEEFAMQYERRLLEPFGYNGYGCCDDLTRKLDNVTQIKNMRRISISPFADVDACAPQLRGNYIFSWKPKPMDLVGKFEPERIRRYIRHTLEVCQENDCVLEMILKDTHACEGDPSRFATWSQIARQEVDRIAGVA